MCVCVFALYWQWLWLNGPLSTTHSHTHTHALDRAICDILFSSLSLSLSLSLFLAFAEKAEIISTRTTADGSLDYYVHYVDCELDHISLLRGFH